MNNPIDSIVGFFNPSAGVKRQQSRMAMDAMRGYDATSKSPRNNGWFRPSTSGAQEASAHSRILANTGQELCRNNPLAKRMKYVWANNAVGKGITLDVNSTTEKKAKTFIDEWDEWFGSTDCDFEGHNTGYGLEHLWMSTVVESGGVFIRQHINPKLKFPLQLQTIEQSYLDRSKNKHTENGVIIDGIQFDGNGQIEGYWFILDKTNTGLGKPPVSKFYGADKIIHMYRKERTGQHIGITWFSSIATTLNNYNTYQDAKLMQQQIAACFALIVENAQTASGLGESSSTLPESIEPSMIEYVEAGTNVNTITPPKADNSVNFDVSLKRDMAVGGGITYEQLTGDYSLVNFASGRMGKTEFNIELDTVQEHLIRPALNKVFNMFNSIYQIKKGKGKYKPDWTFPARSAVNPKEDLDVILTKVRNGLMSPSRASKLMGERFEHVIEQWKKDKAIIGDLPLDLDPSLFASTGNQLDTNDAASSNNETKKEKDKDSRVFEGLASQIARSLADDSENV